MKFYNILLILLVSVCFASAGYCDSLSSQGKYGLKLNLQNASSVSEQANKASSFGSSFVMDPLLNSQINGMGNALQGMTGNTSNIYAVQEQARMQGEYAKQQLKDSD